jgi:hypothetical protein
MGIIIFIILGLLAIAYWKQIAGIALFLGIVVCIIWFLFTKPQIAITIAAIYGIYLAISSIAINSAVRSDFKHFQSRNNYKGFLEKYRLYDLRKKQAMLKFLLSVKNGSAVLEDLLVVDFMDYAKKNKSDNGECIFEKNDCFEFLEGIHKEFQSVSIAKIESNLDGDQYIEKIPIKNQSGEDVLLIKTGLRKIDHDIFENPDFDLDDD